MSKRQSKMDLHIGLYHLECKCSVDCGVALEAVFRASCNLNTLRRLRHRDSTRKIVEVVEYSELGCPKVSHSFGTPWMARLRFPFQSEKFRKIEKNCKPSNFLIGQILSPGKERDRYHFASLEASTGRACLSNDAGGLGANTWQALHQEPKLRFPWGR